VNYWPRR